MHIRERWCSRKVNACIVRGGVVAEHMHGQRQCSGKVCA